MELSTYVIYVLPEGMRDLFAHPAPSRNEVLEQAAEKSESMVLYTGLDVAQALREMKDAP